MLSQSQLETQLPFCFKGADLSFFAPKIPGKVRDNYRIGDKRVLVTTDRLSGFDHILGLVPYKGQVLNQLAAFWFEQTEDIIANHLLEVPDPNVMVGRECEALPVEVVVRGYISGVTTTSLWYQYHHLGKRHIYGMDFPDGMKKNERLPEPIITPTTKATDGHDERITSAQVVEQGLMSPERWQQVCEAAIAVFKRGEQIAKRGGLILVDTKYEFGLAPDGKLMLIDEIHTPDSSRFWLAESYQAKKAAGEEPDNFDKEFVRLWYAAQGYRGEGAPMPLPDKLAVAAARRYIRTYEMITGKPFQPGKQPTGRRVEQAIGKWMRPTRG